MKGNIYDRLWIPKPCHEDWNKMTPDEKGAFCQSCNKSVYDFTDKNEEQVEAILASAASQEVCGRFNSSQLASFPELEIPFYALPTNLSPYRKFVLAIFIVFGTALFGCVNTYGQKMGKIKLVTQDPVHEEELMMKGEVAYIPEDTIQERIMGDTIVWPDKQEIEFNLLGGVSVMPDFDEPVKAAEADTPIIAEDVNEAATCGLSEVTEKDTVNATITGEVMVNYADVDKKVAEDITVVTEPLWQGDKDNEEGVPEDLVETGTWPGDVLAVNSSTVITPGGEPGLTIECYPNPSAGMVNIRYEIRKRSDVKMELFDRSGKRVRMLIDQRGHYNGIYSIAFDLSSLDSGTYICVMQAGEQASSAKVVITK